MDDDYDYNDDDDNDACCKDDHNDDAYEDGGVGVVMFLCKIYVCNIDDFRRVHESYDFVWLSCLRNKVIVVVGVADVVVGSCRCQSHINTSVDGQTFIQTYGVQAYLLILCHPTQVDRLATNACCLHSKPTGV